MKKIFSFALPFVVFFGALFGLDRFEGKYSLSGYDGELDQTYIGEATIVKRGDIYHATWKDDNGNEYYGTGFANNGFLAFVFEKSDLEKFGIQIYHYENGKLEGQWIYYDGEKIGYETLEPS